MCWDRRGCLARYDPLETIKTPSTRCSDIRESLDYGVSRQSTRSCTTPEGTPKDIPRRYTDLLKPQWKDKIGVSTTKYKSSPTRSWISMATEKEWISQEVSRAKIPSLGPAVTLIIGWRRGRIRSGFSVNADPWKPLKKGERGGLGPTG